MEREALWRKVIEKNMGRGSHGVFHVELIKCNSYKVLRWLSKAGESESNMDKVFTNSIFFSWEGVKGIFVARSMSG